MSMLGGNHLVNLVIHLVNLLLQAVADRYWYDSSYFNCTIKIFQSSQNIPDAQAIAQISCHSPYAYDSDLTV